MLGDRLKEARKAKKDASRNGKHRLSVASDVFVL